MIGRRAGRSQRQIAIVAARDARAVPDAVGSAADTAALLELARVFQGRPTQRDARAGVASTARLSATSGAEKLADEPRRPEPDRRRARDVAIWRAAQPRPAGRGLVERHPPRRDRPRSAPVNDSIRQELNRAGRDHRAARPVRPARVPDRDRRAGRAPRQRLRGASGSRAAASCRPAALTAPTRIDRDRLGGLGRGDASDRHRPRPGRAARARARGATSRR